MRNLWIVLVLFVTALTFYSALWFKSERIEQDITTRVTDALDGENATNVGIDVDGRHVTLSGLVYDEATEARYLEAANETHGALGPIDGLTYQADSGYFTAIKTDAGITLRGTVPNEETRAAMLAEAATATDGEVTDELSLAGPEASWQDEAKFGLSGLAALSTGTLTAAAGAYALSGSASGDPAEVEGIFSEREGWKAFVSSDAETRRLAAENAELEDAVAGSKLELDSLSASLNERDGQIDALNGELADLGDNIESLDAELASTRGDLAASQDLATSLQSDLDASGQRVAALTATVAAVTAAKAESDGKVTDLGADLEAANAAADDLGAQVIARDETIAGLEAERASFADVKEAQITTLRDIVRERNGTIEALTADAEAAGQRAGVLSNAAADRDSAIAAIQAQLDNRDAEVARLETTVAENGEVITGLRGDVADRDETIATLQAGISEREGTVTRLQGDVAGRDTTIAALQADLAERNEALPLLRNNAADQEAVIAGLRSDVGDRDDALAALRSDLSDKDAAITTIEGNVSSLQADVADRDAQIVTLRAEAETRETTVAGLEGDVANRDATIASLRDDLGVSDNTVARLNSDVADRDATIEALRADVSRRTGTADDLATQVTRLEAIGQAKDQQVEGLRATVLQIEGIVSDRDATIATLRANPASGVGAEQCAAEAAAALEGSRINFVTASAVIQDESIPLLERLTGIALACVGDTGISVEVGGHTDAQGSEASNQALSEARAQAVVGFMTARGVDAGGLSAVGFGESQPVASNATEEGRAENRRISFDWQAR